MWYCFNRLFLNVWLKHLPYQWKTWSVENEVMVYTVVEKLESVAVHSCGMKALTDLIAANSLLLLRHQNGQRCLSIFFWLTHAVQCFIAWEKSKRCYFSAVKTEFLQYLAHKQAWASCGSCEVAPSWATPLPRPPPLAPPSPTYCSWKYSLLA